MTVKLGLTGSIGMGKSTTAQMFVDEGCALWDADAAVHRLYSIGGAAVEPMRVVFPTAVFDGAVSREALKGILAERPDALKEIERIVHPLVAADRLCFVAENTNDILVFDIPLLFETGGDAAMDATVVVTAPPDVQRQRVLKRKTMSQAQFQQILEQQMPDADKRQRADYIILTDTLEHAREQVQAIVKDIKDNRLA